MGKRSFSQKNTYYDSITLMALSQKLRQEPGVTDVQIAMGTDHNKELLQEMGFDDAHLLSAGAQDLLIGVIGDNNVLEGLSIENILALLQAPDSETSGTDQKHYASLEAFVSTQKKTQKKADLALISVPGDYAAREAFKSLDAGLNIMMFSDNVSLEAEKKLKTKALEKGLFMMGPDCGTAIINGVGLGFANAVKAGPVGIVGASGTGIQEVCCLLDDFGIGISHAIGTGGRDLHQEIGGIMAAKGLQFLNEDPQTELICLISKPPHPEVAQALITQLEAYKKPSVICFLGDTTVHNTSPNITCCVTLTDTALALVTHYQNNPKFSELQLPETLKLTGKIAGLFCGGTLCSEAKQILGEGHLLIDYGDDEYTKGRPHPMIDPSLRADALLEIGADPQVSGILLDFVLGYGSHSDPVSAITDSIKQLRQQRQLPIFASVTGTDQDPQNKTKQENALKALGVIVAPSNAIAAKMMVSLLQKEKEHVH
ncbi:hypothetical protein DID77_01590 [Candidatus Marinamargulisbacteria bacterium SCGC AG-439-L15]|nr:hypothetical protein DID77_01590 [Candidatus Marinamargulisbacteria bacterium SCGC AG-439-L15]